MKNQFSIVLPSFNEINSLKSLIPEIIQEDSGQLKRIIVVDDNSKDGTAEYIKTNKFAVDVICINRLDREGLSSAVIEGIMISDTYYVAVMDADGQHDPKDIFLMFKKAIADDLDLVIGSRFKNIQSLDNHKGIRHYLSKYGNFLANLFINRVTSDPMTGMFLFKRSLFIDQAHSIKPMGFKILLDFMFNIRNKIIKYSEHQINFRSRKEGDSKIGLDIVFSFIDQILNKLSFGIYPEKLSAYLFVGILGIIVNYSILYSSHLIFNYEYKFSQILAVIFSMVFNYHLHNMITFSKKTKKGINYILGLLAFMAINSIGFMANINIAFYLYDNNSAWWLASLVGIIAFTLISFLFSRFSIWR